MTYRPVMSTGRFRLFALMLLLGTGAISCTVKYGLKDASFPPDIKTIKLNFFENKATYINPQFAPKLNERLQVKLINQTPLKRSTSDDADYVISGYVSDYRVTTSGIANQQVSSNNLNVGVHFTLKNNKKQETKEFDVNKAFPFSASLSLQAAEASLLEDIIKGISDEIFNRLFSDW